MDNETTNLTNLSASATIKTGYGALIGMYVNSTSSGTIKFNDGFTGTVAGDKADATITVSGTFSDGDKIIIGDQTYTMKTSLTASTTAYEVLIGVSAAVSLDNLKSAIDKSAGGGTTYGSETVANTTVSGGTNTDTAQVVTALVVGTAQNSVAVSTDGANATWGVSVTTLSGGTAPAPAMNTTITPAIGYHALGGASFSNGLYATIANTLDVTLYWI